MYKENSFYNYSRKRYSTISLSIRWLQKSFKKVVENSQIYLDCIAKPRTFAPAFQERESRLKLTCCKCVLIALTNNQNNLLFSLEFNIKIRYLCSPIRDKRRLFRCLSLSLREPENRPGKHF